MTDRPIQNNGRNALWDHGEHAAEADARDGAGVDQKGGAPSDSFKRLSREEAAVLRAQEPPVSPWRTIAVQMVVGVLAALVGWLITGRLEVMWSLLYGAATVVVPGALMARGMTSKLTSLAAG